MTWTILTTAVCAAWLVYEYRTAPIIESTEELTGNECQCHGSKGIDSNHDGELRRAKEGMNDGGFFMADGGDGGGFTARRVDCVDVVARYRNGHWQVGLWNGCDKWLWHAPSQLSIRKIIASLATNNHVTWTEAAGVNAFLMRLELDLCKVK